MINKTDLRIGNSVMYDDRIFQISAITDEFPLLNTAEFGIGVVDWNNIHPIPITEEALVKMGFEYSESKEWLTLKLHNGIIDSDRSIDFSTVYAAIYEYKFAFAKSIHQLQNLFYFLCGTELKFN